VGAAHGDVGEFAAAAVFEAVGSVDGGALGAVDSDGVAVREVLPIELFAGEVDDASVIHAGDERLVFGTDFEDVTAFTGDGVSPR
jgi:hypothetical protein